MFLERDVRDKYSWRQRDGRDLYEFPQEAPSILEVPDDVGARLLKKRSRALGHLFKQVSSDSVAAPVMPVTYPISPVAEPMSQEKFNEMLLAVPVETASKFFFELPKAPESPKRSLTGDQSGRKAGRPRTSEKR